MNYESFSKWLEGTHTKLENKLLKLQQSIRRFANKNATGLNQGLLAAIERYDRLSSEMKQRGEWAEFCATHGMTEDHTGWDIVA